MKGMIAPLLALGALAACGPRPIDPRRQIGPDPYLPAPHQYLLPPMHVSKAIGWRGGATPGPAGYWTTRCGRRTGRTTAT